jgi:hypothetical protein
MRMLPRDFTDADVAGLRVLCIPSGIGEFQWMATKLHNVHRLSGERFAIIALDGAPRRLHQFAEMHPFVEAFGWATFDYSQIREFQKFNGLNTWARIRELFGLGQMCMLACNPALEAGTHLSNWLPDLPTTYSYPVNYTDKHIAESLRVIPAGSSTFNIGVSCASYRGAAAWHTWERQEWEIFLRLIAGDFPDANFVLLGGSWDDLTVSLFDTPGLRFQTDSKTHTPPIGTLSFGGAMATLTACDAYIGFSSGLGHVAAHLCATPVFMLWPDHEEVLSRTWCNPKLLENGKYVPSLWKSPEEVYASAYTFLHQAYSVKGEKTLWQSPGSPVQSSSTL